MTGDARRPWTPDVELDGAAAAELIASQFEDLPRPRLELLGSGWDNVAWLVDGRYVFRFPQRALGAVCMRNEIACLPTIAAAIAPSLGVAVPRITHVGRPAGGYPYPFAGYARIPGRTACSVVWTDAARACCAAPLGRFLAALHRAPLDDAAPVDPAGDKSVAMLVARTEDSLARIAEDLPSIPRARAAVRALAATPDWDGEAAWSHGDLYARHLLVGDALEITGVIDWGDVHGGDRADDLSIAFAFLPQAARETFFDAYGPVDAATRSRARLYALHSGALIAAVAPERGDPSGAELGRAALAFASDGD